MRRLRVSTRLALLLVAGSCTGRESGRAPGSGAEAEMDSTPVAASAAAAADSPATSPAFQATSAPVERRRLGSPAILRDVRAAPGAEAVAGAGARYDRVVFEFEGDSLTGYRVAYADRPARRCGSGDPVLVAGAAQLLVRLEPAQAHDAGGRLSVTARALAPGLPAVNEMKLICDFEGQVEWVLGVGSRDGYRVSELTGPPRVVIDVARPR